MYVFAFSLMPPWAGE